MQPAGAFRPAPGVPFVLPKGTKSAHPASAPQPSVGVPCAARKPRPDSNSLRSLRSLHSNSESDSEVVAGWRPRPVLLCCSALQDGATPKQPAANSRETVRRWQSGLFGCWLLALAVSAICTPAKRTATRGLAKQASTTGPDSLFEWSERSERSEFESAPGREHCSEPRRGGVSGGAVLASFAKTKEARVQGVEPLAGCTAKNNPDR